MKTEQLIKNYFAPSFSNEWKALHDYNHLPQTCHMAFENKIVFRKSVTAHFENNNDSGRPANIHIYFSATSEALSERFLNINCIPQPCRTLFENKTDCRRSATVYIETKTPFGRPAKGYIEAKILADRPAIVYTEAKTSADRPAIVHIEAKTPADRFTTINNSLSTIN